MKHATVGMFLIAAVALVGVGAVGCGGEETTPAPPVRAPAAPDSLEISCDEIIGGARYSGTELGNRIVLDAISLPPEYDSQGAAPSGEKKWPYLATSGLVIRGGASPVEVSVPQESRPQVAISVGSSKIVHSLRIPSCPSYGLPWNAFESGLYLRERTACVPLTFRSDGRERTVRFGIGTRCKPA